MLPEGLPSLATLCGEEGPGLVGGCASGQVWEFDGSTWEQVGAEGPGPLIAPAVVYDAARRVTWIFGGLRLPGPTGLCPGGRPPPRSGLCASGALWSWDGQTFAEVAPTDPEGDGNPLPRGGASLGYDAARQALVLYGGATPGPECGPSHLCGDVWEWEGTSWRRVRPIDPEGDRAPAPRALAQWVAAPGGGLWLLGGLTNEVALGRTDEFDDDEGPAAFFGIGHWASEFDSPPFDREWFPREEADELSAEVWHYEGTRFARVAADGPVPDGALTAALGASGAVHAFASVVYGNEIASWTWRAPGAAAPAQLYDFDVAAARTFGRAALQGATLAIDAAAAPAGATAQLSLWREGRFLPLPGPLPGPQPGPLPATQAVELDPRDVEAGLLGGRIRLALRAVAPTPPTAEPARLTTGYAALTLRFRWPGAGSAEPCGAVSAAGYCAGSVATFCEEGALRELDCAASSSGGRCELGTCRDLGVGAACDGARSRCESSLYCLPDASGASRCQALPAAWRCGAAHYASGDGCDCGCGAPDPDCRSATAGACDFCDHEASCSLQPGCPGDILPNDNAHCSVCGDGVREGSEQCEAGDPMPETCVACQRQVPANWTCAAGYYGTDDGCDCGCGAPDPDCDGKTIEDCLCNPGTCDASAFDGRYAECAAIDPDDLSACVAWTCGNGVVEGPERCDPPDGTSCDASCLPALPAAWTCDPGYYGTDDGCDCGCGAPDPDCPDASLESCGFCDCPGECAGVWPEETTQCL